MNLLTIPDMIQKFGSQGVKVGLSDHSMHVETVIAAVAMGAKVVEKHFTRPSAKEGLS
jgi:sialic acid synthase SpsE